MQFLNSLKLGHKFIALFLAMASITALTGLFGILTINKVGGEVITLLKARAAQQKLVMLMKINIQESRALLLKSALAESKDAFEEARDEYQEKTEFVTTYCDILLRGNPALEIPPMPAGSPLVAKLESLQQNLNAFKEVGKEIVAVKEEALSGSGAGTTLRRLVAVDMEGVTEKVKGSVDELLNLVGDLMVQANTQAVTIKKGAEELFVAVIVCGVLLALLFGMLTKRSIVRRVDRMAKALARGAEGDLTVKLEIDSADEMGELSQHFNTMVERLSDTVGKVKHSIEVLGQVSENIEGVSRQSVTAAELQSEGITRTSRSIAGIVSSINEVGRGMDHLSQSATESSSSTIELAASLEEVVLNVEQLASSVEAVSASIVEMVASIKQIDASVASLAEASTTTASSVAEMTSSIKEVERSALDNAQISNEVLHDAEEGRAAVEATTAGMEEIRRSSAITSQAIASLSEQTGEIGNILTVIDDVSEQTTLLALNAAIIAAQAGEHGRGFAVVADEIKELAERTSISTREIAAVIKAVGSETERAVDAIRRAEESILDGVRLSMTSGKALGKIVLGAKRATEQMDRIASATREQGVGGETIRRATDQVAEMVAQIAKATKEQGKGSEMIISAAQRMKDLTSQVSGATREQNVTGSLIGQSTSNITSLIKMMKHACDEQNRGSSEIALTVQEMQKATEVATESVKVMDDSARRLVRQMELLQQEISGFTVS